MRLLLHGSTKLGLANTACPFVAAPRPQKALLHLCSASAVPFTTRASLAPLLAHPLQTFVNSGAYLFKEILDGNWQSYLASLVPVGVAVGISYQLCIGLELEIQVAVLRSFAQMLSLGLLLKFLFAENAAWSLLGIIVMVCMHTLSQFFPFVIAYCNWFKQWTFCDPSVMCHDKSQCLTSLRCKVDG
eukprot:c22834_g1_i3 orf=192-752(+)